MFHLIQYSTWIKYLFIACKILHLCKAAAAAAAEIPALVAYSLCEPHNLHPFHSAMIINRIVFALAFLSVFLVVSREVSAAYSTVKFNEGFTNLWGPQHEAVSQDQSQITIWLDRQSGSGFKSLRAYSSGYFSASIKLQAGYTAGTNTAFYLSNNQVHPNGHDEIDIEFLGTIPGKPYTLQTNIYVNSGDAGNGRIVTGREQQIHLWFDPTQDYHRYSILWTPSRIVFLVDNTPIRRYVRTSPSTFPTRPMWVYGSIWDASSWATENGKYRVDYRYEPFVAKYKDFVLIDCSNNRASVCYGRG